MIIDEVTITIEAGDGGNGCLSFRREKFIPRGGPDGGDGGRGGDIYLEARHDVRTLVDFIYRPLFRAHHGEHGKGKNKHGKDSTPIIIPVPVGTMVWSENKELIVDMNENGMKFLIAKGGRGGRGNSSFTTSTKQAPRLAEKGEPGEKKVLRLELKLLADVGILGFPNAGKSTLLSRVTHARPKIADYPFTTLEPQLGVVQLSGNRNFILADVPGLIEGASQGKGLGIRFLRHLERTKMLVHLVDISTEPTLKEIEEKIKVIKKELLTHNFRFEKIPQILVLTKVDTIQNPALLDPLVKKLKKKHKNVFCISSVSGQGINDLMEFLWKFLENWSEEIETKTQDNENIYTAQPRFLVEKREEAYYVFGKEIEKWVAMTNFNSPDAVERFHKILYRMGVLKELKKKGIKEGDPVFMVDEELIYQTDRLGTKNEK